MVLVRRQLKCCGMLISPILKMTTARAQFKKSIWTHLMVMVAMV